MDIYTTINLKKDETHELIHSNLQARNNPKQDSIEMTSECDNPRSSLRKISSNSNMSKNSFKDSQLFAPNPKHCKSGHNLDSPFISESSTSLQFLLPSNKTFRNDNNLKITGNKKGLFQDFSSKKESNGSWAVAESCFISKLSLNSDKPQNMRHKFNDSCLCATSEPLNSDNNLTNF